MEESGLLKNKSLENKPWNIEVNEIITIISQGRSFVSVSGWFSVRVCAFLAHCQKGDLRMQTAIITDPHIICSPTNAQS